MFTDADEFLLDLQTQTADLEKLQAQIDEIYIAQPELAVDEDEEKDKLSDAYRSLKGILLSFQKAGPLWDDSSVLLRQLTHLMDSPQPDSPTYRSTVESLYARCMALSASSASVHRVLPQVRDRFLDVEQKANHLHHIVSKDHRDPRSTPPVPAPSVPTSVPPSSHSGSTLHIEVPTFDGDPLKWEVFESRFRAAIKTRAKGHSDLEIQGHLIKAVQHPLGQSLLHNLPCSGTNLDSMMTTLKERFGSPEVVSPLLIQKINKATHLGLNSQDLNDVYNNVSLSFQKLQSLLGDSLSAYLGMIVVGMMSPECKREWLRHKKPGSIPDMSAVTDFIKFWIKELAPEPGTSVNTPPATTPYIPFSTSSTSPSPRFRSNSIHPTKKSPNGCPACKEQHGLLRCPSFNAMDVDKRNKLVRECRLCLNCFSSQHGFKICPGRYSCKTCGGCHHTMLHRDREPSQSSIPTAPIANLTAASQSSIPTAPIANLTAATSSSPPSKSKSLHTVPVTLTNNGNTVKARALLDTGASVSVMTEKIASDLKLKRTHNPQQVTGTAGTTHCKFEVTTQLNSHDLNYQSKPITFTVFPKLPCLQVPPNHRDIVNNPALRSYQLADPDLGGQVDILLGVDDTYSIVSGKPFRIDGLLALPTYLGLCLSGPLLNADPPPALMASVPPTDLQEDFGRLWELDQVPEAPSRSREDEKVIQDFHDSYSLVNGRFSVSLLRLADPPAVGETRKQAVSRLFASERTLSRHDKLEAFSTVMKEYLTLDHAEVIPKSDILLHPHYYLPVHGVFKETSTTTKVRAVFDASAKSTTGVSLNDTLLAGPNLYPPLSDVLLRFRHHSIAMSADISKMFREVLLNPKERDWHRFLMRGESGQIQDCRMKRLTFGVKCSPFLATQVLRTLADLNSSSFPSASAAIIDSFYVDDFLSSTNDLDSAMRLRSELCQLLSCSGMLLRKWRSNSRELLNSIPEDLREQEETSINISPPNKAHKALGMHWDTVSDNLFVAVPVLCVSPVPVTKRMIASGTAGVFDVLGLFSPAVILARILFQDTWKLGLSWDSPVPDNLQQRWDTWLSDLPHINAHPVPRRMTHPSKDSPTSSALHGFCDASIVAYGAAVYLRTEYSDGSIHTALVSAKARVLPVRPITIPKAELQGAHLLAKLLHHIANLLDIPIGSCFAWTDSEIVIHWLPKSPPQLDRFVANSPCHPAVAPATSLETHQLW